MNQTALHFPSVIESVVATQRNGPLIAAAAVLWIKDTDKVLDVTYGRGLFWADYRPADLTTHDLAIDGVDFRKLPHDNRTFDVVVFDPPYIVQGGRDTSNVQDFMSRYGLVDVPTTVSGLDDLISTGLAEASRVLAPGGRLFVKCCDFVSSGRYVAGRHKVVGWALELGLEQVDEFVHYSGTGPQPKRLRQLHSRRAHSFLCIFQKGKPRD